MSKDRLTYNELYWMYKRYVVLMKKTYMYKAYDDSARVLSYLLEYKLYEDYEGIAAAGPDKEKIMRVLDAHHVNYVISEFGQLTESHKYPDNCFDRYLRLAQDLPVQQIELTGNPGTVKEPTNPSAIEPPPKPPIPDWLVTGAELKHKSLGIGKVTLVNGYTFTVLFDSGTEKRFIYPGAFEQKFLAML